MMANTVPCQQLTLQFAASTGETSSVNLGSSELELPKFRCSSARRGSPFQHKA